MLLGLLVSDYILFLPITINLINYWVIFFKNNLSQLNKKNNWDKSISVKNIIVRQNPSFVIRVNIIFNSMMFLYLYVFSGYSTTFWWSHFKINNYLLYLYMLIILINNYFLYITEKHIKISNKYSVDFIFSIINITLFIPLIFLANTLFTFFFLIELVSCSIFYKFIVSKIYFKNKNTNDNYFSIFSKNYLNVLFYQYWSSFFSSVLIIFSFFFFYTYTGTTEWSIMNFIISSNSQINYNKNYISTIIICIVFIIGFIVKLGIAPIQLYKIEVYKGLPFLSIFFYTTFYFLIFFLFFSLLFIYYLSSLTNFYWIILFIISIIGLFYILSILFDINLFKSFLAYSTIINSVSFILLLLSIIF
uniref:Ymf65 n=1 Tax=Tetrahymena rostrata TaxID=5909 RepID=A0A6G5NK14_TETRO|nr:Ymf65 [Tetrahymena rostrata]QBI37934.1 Ymf65 [Tetrahymena rostrata]URP31124.1 Ymf65 [Tetrahymena rostrata]